MTTNTLKESLSIIPVYLKRKEVADLIACLGYQMNDQREFLIRENNEIDEIIEVVEHYIALKSLQNLLGGSQDVYIEEE